MTENKKHNAIIFIFYKERILLILRDNKSGVANPGMWGLPGGAMEKNETSTQCIKRECMEEIGIIPKHIFYIGKEKGEDRHRYFAYIEKKELDNIKLGNEGKKIEFFYIHELLDLKLTPRLDEWLKNHFCALMKMANKQAIESLELGLEAETDSGLSKTKYTNNVLVGGCFDLLHLGHIHLLQFAKSISSDLLQVAVLSDKYISSYKGNKRPIQDEQTRLQIVKNIKCVDHAFITHEDPYSTKFLSKNPYYETIVIGYADSDKQEKKKKSSRIKKVNKWIEHSSS